MQIYTEIQSTISGLITKHRNRTRKVDDLKMAWGTFTKSKSFQKPTLFPQCFNILSQPGSQNVLYSGEIIMSLCPYPFLSWVRLIKCCPNQAWNHLFRVTWASFIPVHRMWTLLVCLFVLILTLILEIMNTQLSPCIAYKYYTCQVSGLPFISWIAHSHLCLSALSPTFLLSWDCSSSSSTSTYSDISEVFSGLHLLRQKFLSP